MPHHKSAKKRVGTNEKARVANLAVKSRVRSALKKVRDAKTQTERWLQAVVLRWRVRVGAQPYLGPRTQGPAT